ncbi:MAG: LysR family transcriptional regulator [Neomegalonema sp.]|nr:LysR family transcriptional regulator [Neomegalonema sp.]
MPDLRGLSLKQLRALSAVVRTGSITQAAQRLSVTPPAITTHLKTLDSLVGGQVIDRTPDGVFPTPLGQALLDANEEIETVIARATNRLNALSSGAEGSVIVGVVSTGKYFAPSIVAAFGKAHRRIDVTLSIGNRETIIAGLERSEYDVAIMGRPPGHLAFNRFVLGDHPHILIAPPDHRLVDDADILPEDLLNETFLCREAGSGTRLLMNRFLDRMGDGRPFRTVEMGTNETIKQAVMAGLGVAIISAHTCVAELAEKRLATLKVQGLPLVRQWSLLRRSDRPIAQATKVFWGYMTEAGKSLIPKI